MSTRTIEQIADTTAQLINQIHANGAWSETSNPDAHISGIIVTALREAVAELEQDRARLAFVLKHGLPSCAFGDEWHYGQYGDGDTYETPEAAINAEMQKDTQ